MRPAPWLVAVCAGRWQLHTIRSARRAGIRVLAVDGNPAACGLREADLAGVVDIRDPRAVIDAIDRAGIVPAGALSISSEAGMESAAAVREHFGLPGASAQLARALTNKAIQRGLSTLAGVPGPRWLVARTVGDAERAVEKIGLPAIVKPTDSAGSRGVSRIDNLGQLAAAARDALAESRLGDILIESALPGPEFTVETFSVGGRTCVLAITEKTKLAGRDTVACELATSRRPPLVLSRIAAVACRSLEALGLREGPGHTEVMLDELGNPALIEAAGRGGGFGVFDHLVPAASGFDVATATARQAVGLPVALPDPARRAVVLRFLPSRPGVIAAISGFSAANRIAGVLAEPLVDVGETTRGVAGDADRLAFVLASADGIDTARARADAACSHISIDITSPTAAHRNHNDHADHRHAPAPG